MTQGRGGYRPAYRRADNRILRLREQELRNEAPVLSMVIGTLLLALLFNASIETMFH